MASPKIDQRIQKVIDQKTGEVWITKEIPPPTKFDKNNKNVVDFAIYATKSNDKTRRCTEGLIIYSRAVVCKSCGHMPCINQKTSFEG
ncbi:MAG: hypothetical protein R3B41_03730 [Candidatus Doudnabacteria bacterium]